MLIHITQPHIDRGCRGDAENCPVKLAIHDASGLICTVAEDYIRFGNGPDSFQIRTPVAVAVWISRYDRRELVEPFEFELDMEGVG